jgi:hypothetical protein
VLGEARVRVIPIVDAKELYLTAICFEKNGTYNIRVACNASATKGGQGIAFRVSRQGLDRFQDCHFPQVSLYHLTA